MNYAKRYQCYLLGCGCFKYLFGYISPQENLMVGVGGEAKKEDQAGSAASRHNLNNCFQDTHSCLLMLTIGLGECYASRNDPTNSITFKTQPILSNLCEKIAMLSFGVVFNICLNIFKQETKRKSCGGVWVRS